MNPDVDERILIVIPAYNEELNIGAVLAGLRQVAPDFDRLVVNDGSFDSTANVVEALGENQLRLLCNLGYGSALQAGMKYALAQGYGVFVTIDADGQHRPQDVPRLVDALRESGAGLVIGSRFGGGLAYATPLGRRIGQLFFSHLTRLLIGRRIYDTTSGFKAMSAAACAAVVHGTFMDFHLETIVRLSLLGFTIVEHPVVVNERHFGRSMHSLGSVFQYPLKTLLLTVVVAMDALVTRRDR